MVRSEGSARRASRLALLLAAPLLFAPSGCMTMSLFDSLPTKGSHVDWHNGNTYGMLALTPITVGIDALIAGALVYSMAHDDSTDR